MTVTLGVPKNWMTTLGGILAGVPPIVMASGISLPGQWPKIMTIIAGVGSLLLGLAAKDVNTHSTAQEVQNSTVEQGQPAVAALPAATVPPPGGKVGG